MPTIKSNLTLLTTPPCSHTRQTEELISSLKEAAREALSKGLGKCVVGVHTVAGTQKFTAFNVSMYPESSEQVLSKLYYEHLTTQTKAFNTHFLSKIPFAATRATITEITSNEAYYPPSIPLKTLEETLNTSRSSSKFPNHLKPFNLSQIIEALKSESDVISCPPIKAVLTTIRENPLIAVAFIGSTELLSAASHSIQFVESICKIPKVKETLKEHYQTIRDTIYYNESLYPPLLDMCKKSPLFTATISNCMTTLDSIAFWGIRKSGYTPPVKALSPNVSMLFYPPKFEIAEASKNTPYSYIKKPGSKPMTWETLSQLLKHTRPFPSKAFS